jgi:putative acetyltransferase
MAAGVTIRAEEPGDRAGIHRVVDAAFGRDAEARLIDALRESPAFIPGLSLVALDDAEVVGHVLLTRLAVRQGAEARPALALAPLAVLPAWQRRGVGSALVHRGLADARALGHRAVIVLGHPAYYPRFGFQPAQPLGLRPPFEVSPGAFQALGLQPGALQGLQGDVDYPSEFGPFV